MVPKTSKETIISRFQVQSWLKASNNTGILNTCTRLWLTESEQATPPTHRGFNKGCYSKFREGSWVQQTPEDSQKTYQQKCCGNNNKDEDNSPKTLMIKIIKLHLRNLDNKLIGLVLFYAKRLGNCIHIFVKLFLKFFCT